MVNIDKKREKRILNCQLFPNLSSQSIILIPSHGKAKSLQKWFCSKKREFTRIEFNDLSALQAAALCGDFFIVNLFIDKIPAHQRYAAWLSIKKNHLDYLAPFFALQQAYREYLKGVESHGKGYQIVHFRDFLEDKSEDVFGNVWGNVRKNFLISACTFYLTQIYMDIFQILLKNPLDYRSSMMMKHFRFGQDWYQYAIGFS